MDRFTALIIGTCLAILRLFIGAVVPPETFSWVDLYKDVAHIFMGALGMAWWFERKAWQVELFVGLSILEVLVAVVSRL